MNKKRIIIIILSLFAVVAALVWLEYKKQQETPGAQLIRAEQPILSPVFTAQPRYTIRTLPTSNVAPMSM